MSEQPPATPRNWHPALPPVTETEDGAARRIGVEIEMIGPDVPAVSNVVARQLGGEARKISRYEYRIEGDEAGAWGVEFDYEYLKRKAREDAEEDEWFAFVDEAAERMLRAGAENVMPVEVVSPPLPMQRLADVQSIIVALRDAGARGAGAGLTYAFGLQLNPELPALDARTIVSYLKAFLCLYDWLVERAEPDMTRRLTRFSAAFPGSYVRKVVAPEYEPERDELMDDYLAANPTRNRALDMLPLFLYLDEQRLRSVVEDPRVKPRPALHYRLPNSEIDRPDWGIHLAWNDWLQVEALAANRERLREICSAYARWLDDPLSRLFENWAQEVARWVDPSGGR